MSHDEGRVCLCVAEHRPAPLEFNRHHILPLYLGGPNTEDNTAWLCPTAHTNVHELLRLLMRDGSLTWGQALALYDVPVSRYAFALAHEGYRRWKAAQTPPLAGSSRSNRPSSP